MTTAISSQQATTTWTIDSAHSLVEFSAKHIMITTVKGRFADFRGTITLDAHQPAGSSVAVEIATPSLDTHNDQRDQHLRAAEFLEVEKHPLITFRSRGVEGFSPTEGNKFRLVGDLTIRGVTREIVLDATYEGQGRDPWG